MCRSIFIFKIVLIFLLSFVGVSQARYSGGSGTPDDPYQIWTVDDWKILMNTQDDWNEHFILMADLDMQAVELSPIGNNSRHFTGTLDGSGHLVRNVFIEQPTGYYVGLFGYLGQDSQIHDIIVENMEIKGRSYVGGLVGRSDRGILTTCSISGSITASANCAGGLVGYSSKALFTSCSATVLVSGVDYVGGLVGANYEGPINNCCATGTVNGNWYVGGLVGHNANGGLLRCSADTETKGIGSNVGGLVGRNEQADLTTCYASGSAASGLNCAGGLVGYSSKAFFTACSSTVLVSGADYVGGLVGANYEGPMNDCYATGTVNGNWYVGGLAGHNANGGLLGCSADTEANGNGGNVGGLVGRNEQANLNACSASGSATSGLNCAGGLVGYSLKALFTACSSTVLVSGVDYVGGLVGANYEGPMNDCYAAGSVNGNWYVGGLIGHNANDGISACCSVGHVRGTGSYIGGLVGSDSQGEILKPCFWDIETSGQTTSALGTGKTTAELQKAATFIEEGWDFLCEVENGREETWTIPDSVDYPMLCWQVFYRIAYAPYPPDGADDVDPNVTLTWMPSITAGGHDVYFGEDFNDVNDGLIETFRGCQTEPNVTVGLPDCPYPDGLVPWTTYYWRVDEVNDADPASPWKGRVWSFTVAQKKAYNAYPADGSENIDPNVVITWTAGFNAQSHTVYFSEDINDVINRIDGVVLDTNSYVPGILAARTAYYWCVDEFDGSRTHKGDVLSFTVRPYTKPWKGRVSANNDDGYAIREGLQQLEYDYMRVGSSNSSAPPYYMSGMVFQDVNVPQGVKIVSAQLKIRSHEDHLTADVYGMIQAEDADCAAAFSSSSCMDERPGTDASVDWDQTEPWLPNTWYESPDITGVIQEVINRKGWSAGNSLAIFYLTREREGGYRQLSSYDRGVDYAAKLEITYEP